MPYTATDICNNALTLLGASSITSIDDTTDNNAIICKRIYHPTVEEMLRSHAWNFAIARAKLTVSVTAPAFGYTSQYPLPTGADLCLRVISVNSELDDYKIEGSNILTDADECNIVYVKKITDSLEFEPLFRHALELNLAAKLAPALRQENSLSVKFMQEYEQVISRAKFYDSIEGHDNIKNRINKSFVKSRWITSRKIEYTR